VSAAQFLSRVIPFVFNIWFVRQLGADDGAVSVWISPFVHSFTAV
jgi:oligosaccharide translocation protein RFT1